MKTFILTVILVLLTFLIGFSQNNGALLLICTQECEVIINGENKGTINANKPAKYELSQGEHFIQCKFSNIEKSEIINIEIGKQKVLKIEFEDIQKKEVVSSFPKYIEPIKVAEVDFIIPGSLLAVGQSLSNDTSSKIEYPKFFYAFEKGDKINIDLVLLNKKGTNAIEITSYPDGNVIYSNNKFVDLFNFSISIPKRGIYKFEIGTNHAFDRNARMTIARTPESEEKKDFNTKVVLKRKFQTVPIQKASEHYINSGRNAVFQGGKSRIIIPVNIPPKTIEWFYVISASRQKEDIENNLQKTSLIQELTEIISGFNPTTTVLNIGISLLTQPPGSDYCDVYLLDYNNSNSFLAKTQFSYIVSGTRENVKSTVVRVSNIKEGQYYLGVKNPDSGIGISIGVEIAAITMEEYYDFEE